jgi:hypothetical protein
MIQAQGLIGGLPISVSLAEGGRLAYAHAGNVPRPPASNERLPSARLVDILRRQNLDSLDLDAEVLTKMLGAAVFGPLASACNSEISWAAHRMLPRHTL